MQYLTSDHLGTPRVITKADGSVAARHDYKPFGEELFAGTGGRTKGMGYGAVDGNRQKFTGYERDNETELDFAQARYNSSTQGRFTSPDSLMGSIGNPQSLNRYAYVNNNPMNFTDPTGHMPSGGAAASIHDGEGGGGSRRDDPTSPQAVLNVLGVLPSEIGSTQLNDFAAEPPAGGAYNGDGIVDTGAGETPANEGISDSLATLHELVHAQNAQEQPNPAPDPCNPRLLVPLDPAAQVNFGARARDLFSPDFAQRFGEAIIELNRAGIVPFVPSAYRTATDQLRMIGGGSGPRPAAALGLSRHQSGNAVDISTNHPQFATIRTTMEAHGFNWGGHWNGSQHDPPHFELNPFGPTNTPRFRAGASAASQAAENFFNRCFVHVP